jgi:hypothetical protein
MNLRIIIIIICIFLVSLPLSAEEKKSSQIDPNLVKVYNPVDGEEDQLRLKRGESANVKIFLGSLGDMLDKFMITLLNMETNDLVSSQLSDVHGEVIFRKIPAGNYSVYVNKRVMENGEFSSVKVTDVKITTYP